MPADPHRIPRKDALRMVRRARRAKLIPVNCWSVDARSIERILAQKGTRQLRIYFAIGDDKQPTLVFLGADAKGRDQHEGEIAEYSSPCPPFCPEDSPFQRAR
jgi:hypothetical protein